ncbi:MAG: hydroxylamine reductase [Deltaproteobacteria bacterium HGW-Deltaproteobacteria-15]|nr:MAG: hydroxylamine reductase [Deltaproteobacteria bacterium HGW-Deltaproteobacteria-15]
MFCYQCEQTANGTGCTTMGICGKTSGVAALQDLLIYSLKGLAVYAVAGRQKGIEDKEVNRFIPSAMFATLTNVDFDPERLNGLVRKTVTLRERLKQKLASAGGSIPVNDGSASYQPASTTSELIAQGKKVGLKSDPSIDPDLLSLQHTLIFGLKGLSAYAHHARDLGQEDSTVYHFVQDGLVATINKNLGINDLLGMVLKCGEVNLRAMELLDAGNTGRYGHPVPTRVPLGARKGKAILVSGHDLIDLEQILIQSEGRGINIYTHGEMLPTHGYPKLKEKYPHFYGHYGTAWQNQKQEFKDFPGAILMTTNCIQKPQPAYQQNIFTTGLVGWPGVPHVHNDDFSQVIARALELPGFTRDITGKVVNVGFARNTVMSVADKVIAGVKNGSIKHIFLVAGCDGVKSSRSYYPEFVRKVPNDCLVLTLACGKFKFFDQDLGDIGGIPRLLDIGQCNDAYSAVQIAVALAKAFDCGVNDLPLSLVLSWYEQKAVAILLTLFALNIKDIRIGPSLPAFITPNVLNVLVKNYNIMPIKTPEEDLKAILA